MVVTPRQNQALELVRQNGEFLEFLRAKRSDAHLQMEATQRTEELHALRGEARAYGELLSLIETSQAAAERLASARELR